LSLASLHSESLPPPFGTGEDADDDPDSDDQ
jgi:hypothetical protein